MVFVRKVPGRSGSTKVQVAERRAGRDVVLEHVGTARSEAELAVLMARARGGFGRVRSRWISRSTGCRSSPGPG